MFGPGIAISASAARAKSASVRRRGHRPERYRPRPARSRPRRRPRPATLGDRDRPRRAAHHHPPPLRPVRLQGRRPDVEVGSIVEIPFGHQKLDGVVIGLAETTDVPDEKLVAPTSVRAGHAPARPRRPRAVDGRGVLLDARAGARARHAAARAGRRRACGPSRRAPTGSSRTSSARCWSGCPGRPATTSPALRRLEKRGLVTITRAARAPRAADEPRAGQRGRAHAPRRSEALEAIEARPARRTCCTA